MPLEKVRKVLKIAKEPLSLETPTGDEEDSHLGDFIEDKNAILPIDAAIQSNLSETTTRVLALTNAPRGAHSSHALRHRPDTFRAGAWAHVRLLDRVCAWFGLWGNGCDILSGF